MSEQLPIVSREFWDVPRIFIVERARKQMLFDCAFDESIDEYPDEYKVSLLRKTDAQDLEGSWADLHLRATAQLGSVNVKEVLFDARHARSIDSELVDTLLSKLGET